MVLIKTQSSKLVALLVRRGGSRHTGQAAPPHRNIQSDGKYDFVPRRKNLQSLANYGLTVIDAKEEIYNLGAGDYHKGPKRDFEKYRPGDIWEFKKEIKGKRFYIKLKISQDSGEEVLKCLGFHEDEFA